MNEIEELKARVAALEWALTRIPFVLECEKKLSVSAISQWLYITSDGSKRHGNMSDEIHAAVTRLADDMAEIPDDLPDFLKRLRRDYPRG